MLTVNFTFSRKVAAAVLVGMLLTSCSSTSFYRLETTTPISPNTLTQAELEQVFELSSKEPGTQLYFSQALGVGFTYRPWPENPSLPAIAESGQIISILDHSIEVFTKDPSISLQEAIQERFLQDYDPVECFVVLKESTEQRLVGYVAAEISFPITEGSDDPWWVNADNCPADYSQTNGIQYFLMNEAVPGTFVFVRIGQYSAASDGTTLSADGTGYNWSHSLRILKSPSP